MINPFYVRWLQGWTFQLVLMEGKVQVEAHGFGICIRTALLHGETPQDAADRLVLEEDTRRHALHQAWLKGQAVPAHSNELPCFAETPTSAPESLVVVQHKTLVS
ncbi:hypothetical protein [Synechococcus sp. CC9311]|uniref:hypothetical protein n=1 Tax=Synechococcus sp. (strain CC9311) TaxID=64471 RepID=UPI0000DDAF14|nr:hypothetical protein [Synechococcus sp. CC9311]ABI45800.1 possible Copper binding proteins, plastocyanin [Synechococcus sp. CC9311]